MSEERERMVKALNSLEVTDWSASCGELEYVLAANTEENIQTLLDAGFTQKMIDDAKGNVDDNEIDLTFLAFNVAGIYFWNKDRGFIEESEWNEIAAKDEASASTDPLG